jgi:hypothetical protein
MSCVSIDPFEFLKQATIASLPDHTTVRKGAAVIDHSMVLVVVLVLNSTDGPGNYDNHEQNGGRLFSVSKMVLEALMYPEAVDDWAEQVRGATAIAAALLQPTTDSDGERDNADTDARIGAVDADEDAAVPALPFPGLVRTAMPAGSLAQAYCKVAYGPSGKVRIVALISVPRVCQRDDLPPFLAFLPPSHMQFSSSMTVRSSPSITL